MQKKLSSILVILVLAGAYIGWGVYKKNQFSAEVRVQAVEFVQQIPLLNEDPAYLESALDEAHEKAFEQSYKMGRRRKAAEFNQEHYLAFLVKFLSVRAASDGKSALVDELEEVRKRASLPPVDLTPQK